MTINKAMLATVALAALTGAGSANAAELANHRAVYDIALAQASERSGITAMNGRMVYEFTGSECAGYTMNFRFVNKTETASDTKVNDQQATNFEDPESQRFEFETRNYTGKTLDREINGNAVKTPNGFNVDIFSPEPRSVKLGPARLPTEHTKEVLARAEAGETVFESRLFDGSDTADKLMVTTTVIGKKTEPAADDEEAPVAGAVGKSSYWPVTIAYFNDETGSDGLPVYRTSFKLHDNGITRGLTLDYGDFVLKGRLVSLEMLKPPACQP